MTSSEGDETDDPKRVLLVGDVTKILQLWPSAEGGATEVLSRPWRPRMRTREDVRTHARVRAKF